MALALAEVMFDLHLMSAHAGELRTTYVPIVFCIQNLLVLTYLLIGGRYGDD